jgi:hypothetical protein
MKKIFIILAIIIVPSFVSVFAMNLSWGANNNLNDINKFKLYTKSNLKIEYTLPTDDADVNQDNFSVNECSDSVELTGIKKYIAVTAFNTNEESEKSNTVVAVNPITYDPDTDETTVVLGDVDGSDYPGTIQDTFININTDHNNTIDQLAVYTWPMNMPANAILMKFDLSEIPEKAKITDAVLTLYQNNAGGDATYDISANRIINFNLVFDSANGFTPNGDHNWTANNHCYNNIPLAQSDIAVTEDVNILDLSIGYKEWEIPEMVQYWVDNPDNNYGMMLNADYVTSSNSYRFFASTEVEDSTQRPSLKIEYTLSIDDADIDQDGFSVNDGDCNDNDANIYPGSFEICDDGNDNDANIYSGSFEICDDGNDQDCDGSDLEYPQDIDEDGYTIEVGDCNDNDATIHPNAEEICGDDIDQNCDGKDDLCNISILVD